MNANDTNSLSTEDLKPVELEEFQEKLSPRTQVRVTFGKAARNKTLNSMVLAHDQEVFWIASLTSFNLPKRGKVTVAFSTKERLYEFKTRLIGVFEHESQPERTALALVRPEKWSSLQRRDDYRAKISVAIEVASMTNPGNIYKGLTVDVSASGMMVSLDEVLPEGEDLEVSFRFPNAKENEEPFEERAKVVRSVKPQVRSRFEFNYGLQFTELSERHKDQLAQFIWAMQKQKVT